MQQALLALCGARKGHFRYESGHHGDLWLDLDRMFEKPKLLSPFVAELAQRFHAHEPHMICGPLTGGAVLAQMLATELGVNACYAERHVRDEVVTYSLPAAVRDSLPGQRVALVDDAINAGSAVGATMAELEACGAKVVAVGALLTLGSRAATLCADWKVPLESLANIPSNLWLPEECPQCSAGMAVENAGT